MPKIKLTAAAVKTLPAINNQQTDYRDGVTPGLSLRVTPSGVRSWSYLYRLGRLKKRHTLGRFPQISLAKARDLARDDAAAVASGKDPAREKSERREATLFRELVTDYLTRHARKKKRIWREDERILKTYFSSLSRIPVASISRKELTNILEKLAERAPIQANRALACVRHLFNWAVIEETLTVSPCNTIPHPGGKESSRERVLNDDGIKAVWNAIEAERPDMAGLYKLRLLTAQRGGQKLFGEAPNTWVKVRGMTENYLTGKWRDGALAGATPAEAFFVGCGLGTAMNSQEFLAGRMNVEIGIAVVRPTNSSF